MDLVAEKKLRDFWYPVAPSKEVTTSPLPFTLLNQKIVLWRNSENKVCAVQDKCSHRGAELSKGTVCNGNIVCPYHSWEFNLEGHCVNLPQSKLAHIPKSFKVPSYHCSEKYDHVWVCLGNPIIDIPDIPEANQTEYRTFPCFWETWNTSSMRVVENELDMAHFASVHKGTFGNSAVPLPLSYDLKQLNDFSLQLISELAVKAPPQQMKNTRASEELTTRLMKITWYMPFIIRLHISYPSGLEHIIMNCPTPINNEQIKVVQFCFRNDTESEASIEDILKFERLILNEDRVILETTPPFVNLDPQFENHIPTDRSGLLMRKLFLKYLNSSQAEINESDNLEYVIKLDSISIQSEEHSV